MTRILSPLNVEYLDNSNRVFLAKPFGIISDVLISHGLRQVGWELRLAGHENEFWVPVGFVFDFESTPNWLRGPLGENKRGGATHDSICRKNVLIGRELTSDELALLNDPNTSKEDAINITLRAKGKITKSIAADVYKEIMDYCDSIDTQRFEKGKHLYIPDLLVDPIVRTKCWARRWAKSTVVRFWPGDFFQKYELTATAFEIYGIEGDRYCTIEAIDAAIVQSKEATDAIKAVPAQVEKKADLVEASEKVTADLKEAKAEVEDKPQ
jgi:hypothetical protein